jgi:hypothetical protein
MADFGDLRDFLGRLGIGHGDWELVNVDGRPFRVAMVPQIFIIGANGVFSKQIAQFANSLLQYQYLDY